MKKLLLNRIRLSISDYYNRLLTFKALKKMAISAARRIIGRPQEIKILYSKEDGVILIWAESFGHGAFVLGCYSDFLNSEIREKLEKFWVLRVPAWEFGKEHIFYVFEEDIDWAVLYYFVPKLREYMNKMFKESPTEKEVEEIIQRYYPELFSKEIHIENFPKKESSITERLSKLKEKLKESKAMKLNKETKEKIIKKAYEAMLDDIIDRYFHPDYIDDELLDEVISNLLEEEGLDPEENIFDKEKEEIKTEVLRRIAI